MALAGLVVCMALVACTGATVERSDDALRPAPATAVGEMPIPAEVTSAPETTTTAAPPPETTSTARPPSTTTSTAPPPPRVPLDVGATEFATVAGLVLVHPSSVVERVGFHESSHDGAQPMAAMPTAAAPTILASRHRGTGPATAVDVVIDPGGQVRAPVSGTVKRAGSYVLYCKYRDDYFVVAPDDRPELEVKVLHIQGVQVSAGDRVVAGETVVAPRATPLPFASQIDEVTAKPSWPHVHIEVVDPAVPDRPSPGGGCP